MNLTLKDLDIIKMHNETFVEKIEIGCNNCVMIGQYAGSEITTGEGIIIIGDNIKNLEPGQKGVLYLTNKILIGETVKGKNCNLKEILEETK